MPSDLRMQIEQTIAEFEAEVDRQLATWITVEDPERFRQLEMTLAQLGRALADGVVAALLKHIVSQPSLQARASMAARREQRLRSGGARLVIARPAGRNQRVERSRGPRYEDPGRRWRVGPHNGGSPAARASRAKLPPYAPHRPPSLASATATQVRRPSPVRWSVSRRPSTGRRTPWSSS
jgi:hypothetical protein